LAAPAYLSAASPNEKLNLAFVGVGGRGQSLIQSLSPLKDLNLAAFSDVDDAYAGKSYEAFPQVRRYTDYRRMYDELERQIDAVVVATPDHHHYPASMMALKRGKHVYCEKPLTYTIEQARRLAKVAREKKLATQMGNQGNSSDSTRLIREWIKAGVLGEIREIHHWNDYPMAARQPRQPAGVGRREDVLPQRARGRPVPACRAAKRLGHLAEEASCSLAEPSAIARSRYGAPWRASSALASRPSRSAASAVIASTSSRNRCASPIERHWTTWCGVSG
jgi:hypothetical protein